MARTIAAEHESRIESARQLLISLAEVPAVRDAAGAGCSAALAAVKRASPPHYANLSVVRANGEGPCSAVPLPGGRNPADINVATVPGFARAAKGEFAVGEYLIGPVVGRPVIGLASPALDADGRTRLVTIASLDLSWLNQSAYRAQLPEGTTVTVVDASGIVLLHSPGAIQIGTSAGDSPVVKAMRSQPAGGTVDATGLDGLPRLHGFAALGPLDHPYGYVAVGIPTAVAYAEAERLRARGLIGLAIAALLVTAAGWGGAELLVLRRLRPVIRTVQRVAEGDLTARTRTPPRHDELGSLATAVDAMTAAIEREQAETHRSRQAVEEARALLDTLFDTAPIGLAFLDTDLRYVRINERLAVWPVRPPWRTSGAARASCFPAAVSGSRRCSARCWKPAGR